MTPKRTSVVYLTFLSTFLVSPAFSSPLPAGVSFAEVTTAIDPAITSSPNTDDQAVNLVAEETPSAVAFAAFLTASSPGDRTNGPPPTGLTFSLVSITSVAAPLPPPTSLSIPTAVVTAVPTDLGLESAPTPDLPEATTSIYEVQDNEPLPTSPTVVFSAASSSVSRTTLFVPATFSIPTSSPSSSFVTPTVWHTKSLSPLSSLPTDSLNPADSSSERSQATENSRSATIVGVFLALGTIMSLMVAAYCLRFRLPCMPRKNRRSILEPFYLEKQTEPRSSMEKASLSDKCNSPTIDLPILPSLPPPARTNPESRDASGEDWRFPPTAHFEGFTEYLSNGPFTEVSLSSVSEIRSSALSDTSNVRASMDRTSSGAASLTGQSFTTCESRYSNTSNGAASEADRVSALIEASNLRKPESVVLAPWAPLAPATRTRSKTLIEPGIPPSEHLSSSKSFPENFLMLGNRWSQESSRSRRTDRSSDSDWDVAQAYGRFSKDSMAPGSEAVYGLPTILEDSEHIESVDVGGKTCLLVKGKL